MFLRIEGFLAKLFLFILRIISPIPKPKKVGVLFLSYGDFMPLTLNYNPVLPAATKPNVVKHTLTYVLSKDGNSQPAVSVDVDVTVNPVVLPVISVEDGFTITISETQSDAKGLVSDPSDPFVFTAIDDLKPPKPEQVGLTFLGYQG